MLCLKADPVEDLIIAHLAKDIVATYLPATRDLPLGGMRIRSSTGQEFTVTSPLTVTVTPLDRQGLIMESLPRDAGFAGDWASESPQDNVVTGHRVVIEVPIGEYRGGPAFGAVRTILSQYDLDKIASVQLSFPIKIRKGTATLTAVISGDVARRIAKQRSE